MCIVHSTCCKSITNYDEKLADLKSAKAISRSSFLCANRFSNLRRDHLGGTAVRPSKDNIVVEPDHRFGNTAFHRIVQSRILHITYQLVQLQIITQIEQVKNVKQINR